MDENGLIGIVVGLFLVGFFLALFAFSVYVWWRIMDRTGHNGWLGLLMFVPIANIVMLLVLAFGEWPIHRELNDLRRRVAEAG